MPIASPYTASRIKKGTLRHAPIQQSMAAWYRYRQGITNVSGACSAWRDWSGNSRTLTQATAASRPLVMSDGSLLFDGSNDYMQATFTLSQPFTLYMALMQVSWTSTDVIVDGVTAATQLIQTATTPAITANAGSALTASTAIGVGSRGVLCLVANGSSSVYQAGGGAAVATITGNAGTNNAGGITLGAARTPALYANIRVFEVIAYNIAHSAIQRLRMLRYLARIAQVGGV